MGLGMGHCRKDFGQGMGVWDREGHPAVCIFGRGWGLERPAAVCIFGWRPLPQKMEVLSCAQPSRPVSLW